MSQTAPGPVLQLIERFTEHADAYRASGTAAGGTSGGGTSGGGTAGGGTSGGGSYNETQIRREFIDPLFKALGWDIDNQQGHAEAYKDVIHEDAIKVGGATKAPDYCFRIGGVRKFFVEAKKPS